jgi:hypothetical protein
MPDSEPQSKFAPSDYLATLKMHVDVANGEKQAIWTRHATMVVGNSVIIAATRADGVLLSQNVALYLNVLGLMLCITWAVMAWTGWTWFRESLTDGADVPIDPSLNPFAKFKKPLASRWKDPIFDGAMAVVVIFALMYLVGLWPLIRSFGQHIFCAA